MKTWIAAPLLVPLLLAGCDAEPTSDVAGVYNVVDVNDNTNLELRDDGTFRTVTIGCDFEDNASGAWSMDGDDVVLEPVGEGEDSWREGVCPSDCFGWSYIGPEGAGLTAAVEEVRLEAQDDGTWRARFYDHIQGTEITGQALAAGGQCMTCGEGVSPCEDPFAHDPYGG